MTCKKATVPISSFPFVFHVNGRGKCSVQAERVQFVADAREPLAASVVCTEAWFVYPATPLAKPVLDQHPIMIKLTSIRHDLDCALRLTCENACCGPHPKGVGSRGDLRVFLQLSRMIGELLTLV